MAQAPQAGGGGAPRQNKTVKQFGGMNTQNQRNAVPEGSFSWLENIQPIGPGNLHSIPGRGLSVVRIPPSTTPGCPVDTVPTGTQDLSVVHCYHYNNGIPEGTLSGNSAGQINFVQGSNVTEFVATVGNASGFGIPYPPASNQWQLLHIVGDTITAVTPVSAAGHTFSFAPQAAQAGTSGHSDTMGYLIYVLAGMVPPEHGHDAAIIYFDFETDTPTFLEYLPPGITDIACWAKKGNRFYSAAAPAGVATMVRWNFATGLVVATKTMVSVGMGNFIGWIRSFVVTTDHLYVLFNDGTADSQIFQLDLDTMAFVNSWTLPTLGNTTWAMDAAGPDLLYVVADGWSFNYFIPSTGSLVHVDNVTPSCNPIPNSGNPAGQPSFHYNAGYFYLSHGGHAFGFVDTVKIGPLVCPGTDIVIGSIP